MEQKDSSTDREVGHEILGPPVVGINLVVGLGCYEQRGLDLEVGERGSDLEVTPVVDQHPDSRHLAQSRWKVSAKALWRSFVFGIACSSSGTPIGRSISKGMDKKTAKKKMNKWMWEALGL